MTPTAFISTKARSAFCCQAILWKGRFGFTRRVEIQHISKLLSKPLSDTRSRCTRQSSSSRPRERDLEIERRGLNVV